MLKVENLKKEFSSKVAVNNVSFHVKKGEIFGYLGPNGAGKTTTIRMVLNIIAPDSGTVLFNDEPFTELTKNRVGYLPEERGLYKKNKLMDMITYFAGLKGIERSKVKPLLKPWLEKFELKSFENRKIEELSKGNQQKVQFIISVLHDPDLLILDEPFTGFDPINQDLLKESLIDLKNQGKTIIFSTHQMEQVEKLCDNMCLINDGEILLSGSLRDIKKKYGNNAVKVDFSGDGAFLKAYPDTVHTNVFENYAELVINENFNTNNFLKEISGKLDIKKFEVSEPSLHSIFVNVVSKKQNNKTMEAGK
jgi:ABC-2 type transport system ATP-binding protein